MDDKLNFVASPKLRKMVKRLIKETGHTQKEIAKALGWTQAWMWQMLNLGSGSMGKWEQILNYIGYDLMPVKRK